MLLKIARLRAALCVLAVIVALSPVLAAQTAQTIMLNVDAREAARGILHAQLSFPVRSGSFTLLYPKWIPGEHGPTGPISDLVGLKLRANGRDIPWQRDPLDLYAFHCEIPAGVQNLEVSLDFLPQTDPSGFTSAASTSPYLAVINWNQVLLYPQGRTAADWSYQPSLRLPSGWKYGTALPVSKESVTGEDGGAVQFQPVSLETLVDSPVIAGEYLRKFPLGDVDGRAHEIDIVGDDAKSLELSPDAEAGLKQLIAEGGALFGSRHYRRYNFLLTLSDHVAHFGLEHHESSDNRLPADTLTGRRPGQALGYILPHEFAHSWIGKYRRPAGLVTPDYSQPMNMELLWVYEGLTEYYGDVLPVRSGMWTGEDFRVQLAWLAAALDHRAGRSWRPLQDTAVSAPLLYFSRPAWSDWRRGTDFYDEAALVWLEVDVMLRQKSNGRTSLDEFCRRFFGGASGPPAVKPFTLPDIIAALTELVSYDWKGFFAERLTSTASHAPLGGIEQSGWKLTYRDTPPDGDSSDRDDRGVDLRYSLGLSLGKDGEITDVLQDGPATKAGLAPDMKLIAVNGRKYSPSVIRQAIQGAKAAADPIEILAENRETFRTYRVDYHEGERFPYLERDPSKLDLLDEILQPLVK